MKRQSRNCKASLMLVAPFALILAGCQQAEEAAPQAAEAPPVPVSVLNVQREAFVDSVPVTGSLVSRARVEVKAETLGRLVKFPKEEGDRVAAEEVVASVDEENYRIAIRQAETSVQVAEATLERAQVMEAHGQSESERARNLIQSGGITDKDLKTAEVTEREARAQVALAEAQLEQTRAALESAEKRLRDTAIRSPVGGEIERKYVNVGAYVEAPTIVFAVVDNSKLELEAPVASAHLGRVRAGQTVRFRVNSYPDVVFEGRVVEVNPTVDAATRAAKVRVQVNNSGGRLKAGMFAQGEIVTNVQEGSIIIPAAAVYRNEGSVEDTYVYVVNGNRAVRRQVRLAGETDSKVVVGEGLQPGDVLIAEQSIELAEGVRVQPEE